MFSDCSGARQLAYPTNGELTGLGTRAEHLGEVPLDDARDDRLLLVVDLEATCSDNGAVPKHQMEIIEIGAVLARPSAPFEAIDEFQAFVKPVRHPVLTPFCTRLTYITQADVDAADAFAEVMDQFVRWAVGHGRFLFCSWGDYDRKQFLQDCGHRGVRFPLGADHINLKARFSERQGLKKRLGMAQALEAAGLALEGRHHRGIDDARNIARLLPWIFGNASTVCSPATKRSLHVVPE